jgi:hypothetical protein
VAPPPAGAAEGVVGAVPWEDTSRPARDRFFQTMNLAFRDPRALFTSLQPGDLWTPLVYGWIVTGLGSFAGGLWNLGMGSIVPAATEEERQITLAFHGLLAVLGPLFAPVWLFLYGGIFHLCLTLFGAGGRGFSVTFRVICYGATPYLLLVVPLCGSLVGGVWTLVLWIWGAALAQRTSGWIAFIAYFLPAIVCCALGVALGILVVTTGVLAQ